MVSADHQGVIGEGAGIRGHRRDPAGFDDEVGVLVLRRRLILHR